MMVIKSTNAVRQLTGLLSRCQRLTCVVIPERSFHVTSKQQDKFYDPSKKYKGRFEVSEKWTEQNFTVYPPTEDGEPSRPAEVYHQLAHLPITPKKLWYSAFLVRGLSIDEAIKQCEFSKKQGAKYIKKALIEAQEMAVHDFNVEYRSNLWVADSFCEQHFKVKTAKRQRRYQSKMYLKFSYYFVRLREGKPPKEYYPKEPSGNQKLEEYVQEQRARRITHAL